MDFGQEHKKKMCGQSSVANMVHNHQLKIKVKAKVEDEFEA